MREKQLRFIVTFPTTTGAMEMERLCRQEEIPGRLIPVPRTITAGCGMCWSAPPEEREWIENWIMDRRLTVDGLYDIWM